MNIVISKRAIQMQKKRKYVKAFYLLRYQDLFEHLTKLDLFWNKRNYMKEKIGD